MNMNYSDLLKNLQKLEKKNIALNESLKFVARLRVDDLAAVSRANLRIKELEDELDLKSLAFVSLRDETKSLQNELGEIKAEHERDNQVINFTDRRIRELEHSRKNDIRIISVLENDKTNLEMENIKLKNDNEELKHQLEVSEKEKSEYYEKDFEELHQKVNYLENSFRHYQELMGEIDRIIIKYGVRIPGVSPINGK